MPRHFIEKHWDYSPNARYYRFRPNYPGKAIDLLIAYTGARRTRGYRVADIGAGTGNLSVLLLDRGLKVAAIEPNDEMRKIGMERTRRSKRIEWIKAGGLDTTLGPKSADWVTFGSSFNVMDRARALKEAHRVLRTGGYFTCMWNHRDLSDPVQKTAEDTIVEFVPGYDRGVRREDQRRVIEDHKALFGDIFYFELDFCVRRTIGDYINAWRSVKNKYWDLSAPMGRELFRKIALKMKERLPGRFDLRYTMRAWTARKA